MVVPIASSSAPAAARPQRPTLTTEDERALERMLRPVCEIVYTKTRSAGYRLGCGTCTQSPERLDPAAFAVAVDCDGDAACTHGPLWDVKGVVHGAFSARGVREAHLIMKGSCNPKHAGALIVRQVGDRWSLVGEASDGPDGDCHAIASDDGPDRMVCVPRFQEEKGAYENAVELRFRSAPGGRVELRDDAKLLFSIPHREAMVPCKAKTHERPPPGLDVRETFVESSEVVDADKDGRPDLRVRFVVLGWPAKELVGRSLGEARATGRAVSRHVVTLRNDGRALVPDGPSIRFLQSQCGLDVSR